MRVIAGLYRGRRLAALPDSSIRPTIARLRESYFNIVQARIAGSSFLDLCSGSGSIGIEALSRGARQVVFIEKNRRALAVLQKNLDHCGIGQGFQIISGDIFREIPRLGEQGENFDLIYFDPPYFQEMYETTLRLVAAARVLAPAGLLAADHFKKTELPEQVGDLRRRRMVRHGDSVLSFYGWSENENEIER